MRPEPKIRQSTPLDSTGNNHRGTETQRRTQRLSKAGAERREKHALLQLDEFPTATQWILSVSHSVPSVSLWFTRLLPHCASALEPRFPQGFLLRP